MDRAHGGQFDAPSGAAVLTGEALSVTLMAGEIRLGPISGRVRGVRKAWGGRRGVVLGLERGSRRGGRSWACSGPALDELLRVPEGRRLPTEVIPY